MRPGAEEPAGGVQVAAGSVMSAGERAVFLVLTAIVVLGGIAFARSWLALADDGVALVGFVIITMIGGFLWLSWFGRWLLLWKMRRPIRIPWDQSPRVAAVTTFVPGAEPLGMLEQAVRAMVAMDGPHETWILDEGGAPEVAALCRRLGARYFSRKGRAEYLSDEGRFAVGTKYGNYNAWLAEHAADYDILVSFDPDHIPERVFLSRVLGYFADPRVAYVQAPQVYYNQRASFVASGAAEESYAYYSTHHMASYGLGQPILVGSHSTQRIAALVQVGGFAAHDADDLLITMRYRAAGWKGVFVPEILALGLTPVAWSSYLRQQLRWSRSVVDLKLKQLPRLAGRLPLVEWLLNLFHGVFYLRSLKVPVLYAVVATLIVAGVKPAYFSFAALGWVAALVLLHGLIGRFRYRFYLDRRREGAVPWRSLLLQLVKWPYQAWAVWTAIRGRPTAYEITMKVRGSSRTVVLWPHWVVAVLMAAVLIVGFVVHGAVAPPLAAFAVLVVLLSAGVALSELRPEPAPWDPEVYRRRRAELADVIGPMRWPSVERRRVPREPVSVLA
ncbi:MAG: glycosyltransferase [Gemmatimonadales bacterium]